MSEFSLGGVLFFAHYIRLYVCKNATWMMADAGKRNGINATLTFSSSNTSGYVFVGINNVFFL